MMPLITENQVEQATIDWFQSLGYAHCRGGEIAPDGDAPERSNYRAVVLEKRLAKALRRLNPDIPPSAIDDGLSQLINPNIPGLLPCNRYVHRWLTRGITVTFRKDGQETGRQLNVIDFDNPQNNDWLVVDQFSVKGVKNKRRPDVVVFVNGLPLAVIELKNPASRTADIWSAHNQLQTYKREIPDLFHYNVCLIISDGIYARMGSLSAERERFMRWRTIGGESLDPLGKNRELETLVNGVFRQDVFLSYLRHFCLFEENGEVYKKVAAYHQFDAVQKAVESVVKASGSGGSKKGGVVWHTQGAGKSIEMAYLAGRLMTSRQLGNPTLVMVTDRLDLDGQLFGVFSDVMDVLGDTPDQAASRAELRDLLKGRPSGGIIFTTIQKFGLEKGETQFPTLSDRDNIVVIADEAHRTQYGISAKLNRETGEYRYGLAGCMRDALPNATFLAFTGTPLSQHDRNTRAVFGEYVSIYDIQQAVEDGATVPIYYESRLAKLALNAENLQQVDDEVERLLEDDGASEYEKEKARRQWAAQPSVVGAPPRLQKAAADIVSHYETRCETQPGKAMVVAMSRDICVRLYDELVAIRPEWHSDDHMHGTIKVVMTASATDDAALQKHHTSASQKKAIEKRFKDPHDPLRVVIVCDMWLTGFDAPCLATMYVDKPMQGANLAQAIARVNRVFKDKPGGLVVDYIGIAADLKQALLDYSAARGKGRPTIDSAEMLAFLQKRLADAAALLRPVDWSEFRTRALQLLPACMNRILEQENGKRDYCDIVLQMTRAFALCGTLEEAKAVKEKVAFHQAIRALLTKSGGGEPPKDHHLELQRLLSLAIESEAVEDVFHLAGIKHPDISILSDEFLNEVRKMPHKDLAAELMRQLLDGEIRSRFSTNVVQQHKFSELLENSMRRYANRVIEAAQVIEELIAMARDMQADLQRIERLNLSQEEYAFYDALAQSDSVQQAMEDEALVTIARAIVEVFRKNAKVDWAIRESVRADLRLLVGAQLRKHKYPPDQQPEAVELVIKQAEVISEADTEAA